MFVYTNNEVSK